MKILTVINPFDGHDKGDRITANVEEILAGEHVNDVVASHELDMTGETTSDEE